GMLLSNHTLTLPSIDFNGLEIYNTTSPVGLLRSSPGNIIVFGSITNTMGNYAGYIAKCDLSGNVIWSKNMDRWLHCGTTATDNGYLFNCTGNYTDPFVYLLKVSDAGDSLWSKKFLSKSNFPYTRQIVRTDKNNYRFCFNSNIGGNT